MAWWVLGFESFWCWDFPMQRSWMSLSQKGKAKWGSKWKSGNGVKLLMVVSSGCSLTACVFGWWKFIRCGVSISSLFSGFQALGTITAMVSPSPRELRARSVHAAITPWPGLLCSVTLGSAWDTGVYGLMRCNCNRITPFPFLWHKIR